VRSESFEGLLRYLRAVDELRGLITEQERLAENTRRQQVERALRDLQDLSALGD
jgi:hypothetical protein